MLVEDFNYTPFNGLMTDFIKRNRPAGSSTAKGRDRNAALHQGWIEGVACGLAALATAERIRLIRPVTIPGNKSLVSAVYDHDVNIWLKTVRERWDSGVWKGVDDDEFFAQVWGEFMDQVVYGNNWRETFERERKQAVLAGIVNPQPEDKEWLEAEFESFHSITAPYKAALDKLSSPTPAEQSGDWSDGWPNGAIRQ
jgi:hypothetical protein